MTAAPVRTSPSVPATGIRTASGRGQQRRRRRRRPRVRCCSRSRLGRSHHGSWVASATTRGSRASSRTTRAMGWTRSETLVSSGECFWLIAESMRGADFAMICFAGLWRRTTGVWPRRRRVRASRAGIRLCTPSQCSCSQSRRSSSTYDCLTLCVNYVHPRSWYSLIYSCTILCYYD